MRLLQGKNTVNATVQELINSFLFPSSLKPGSFELCEETAIFLLNQTKYRPKVGIICGTGLQGLGELVESPDIIPYSVIPNFPQSTADGHKSRCIFGLLGGTEVFLMQGRFHLYEGYPIHLCAMPVRVMKLLGVSRVILSNAAGGLGDGLNVGDIMILKDHINFPALGGTNPLFGANDERFGPRFFALHDAYSYELRRRFLALAKTSSNGLGVSEGVYAMCGGPSFETPAELRMMKLMGADAVGMSTVHEVINARHCGLEVFAFSLITNMAVLHEYNGENHSGESVAITDEVANAARKSESRIKTLIYNFVSGLNFSA